MDQSEIIERNEKLSKHILALAKKKNWKSSLNLSIESMEIFKNEEWLSSIDSIYLVGHGTSLATALVAESWFAHISKRYSKAFPAFHFNSYIEDFIVDPQKTLVIGISCSGNTESVVQSLKMAKRLGAVTMCISGTEDMDCAKEADYWIKTDAHKDRAGNLGAYTISHIFILLGAFQLAVLLGQKNGSLNEKQAAYWREQLQELILTTVHLPELFSQMEVISESVLEMGADRFIVLGTGPNYGTMKEGALKISELSWFFGAGEELEDFAHGRFREVDETTPLLIISPAGRTYAKTMDLLAGCNISKTPSIIITENATIAMKKLATHVVEMPNITDEYLTPLLYIFPLWFFGYHICSLQGRLVGEVRHNLKAVNINFRAHFNDLGDKKE